MITDWSNRYDVEDNLPGLLPCAANLCLRLGEDHIFFIVVNECVELLKVFCAEKNKINTIMKYIADAFDFVNRTMYRNQLKVGITLQKVEETNVYRNASFREEKIMVTGTDTKEAVKQNKILQALLDFSISEIHENDEEMTLEEFIKFY